MLVVTKYFCCDKPVATSILLLWQKACFVMTKIILVAAPANDSCQVSEPLTVLKSDTRGKKREALRSGNATLYLASSSSERAASIPHQDELTSSSLSLSSPQHTNTTTSSSLNLSSPQHTNTTTSSSLNLSSPQHTNTTTSSSLSLSSPQHTNTTTSSSLNLSSPTSSSLNLSSPQHTNQFFTQLVITLTHKHNWFFPQLVITSTHKHSYYWIKAPQWCAWHKIIRRKREEKKTVSKATHPESSKIQDESGVFLNLFRQNLLIQSFLTISWI